MRHSQWKLSRERKIAEGYVESPEAEAERELIQLILALGQAVHDRRVAMGLSEAELGAILVARSTNPQVSDLSVVCCRLRGALFKPRAG